ncbi:alpha/beta hydrolase [Chryseotalea sanaruensis]|uniref:Alpha/beta hydrolase n=1 Tax=Chryseotalea sanaruensis TaxID=2482724 RepID=A0A401U7M0_9BACT|nr:alpha/beta hydrolase [Chryseotalea sanaruensis]GCC50891.1 alpha/beta hydrolase [Chryseotalea sanaruensis]
MTRLFYSDSGNGQPVVLLHGFLETNVIWKEFSENLSADYRILAFDLPGFGQSPLPEKSPFTLNEIAGQINDVLVNLGLNDVFLIGHSLGGYVSLAMVEARPDIFSAFCLFHSSALADSEEKKEARTKTIDFVKKNGALAFTSNFVPPLFADPNHTAVSAVKQMAIATSEETVTHYLGAMRDRPERISLLKKFPNPILFLAGENDSVIPVKALIEQSKLPKKATIHVLTDVGHMGMVESPVECLTIIKEFLSHIH